MRLAWNERPQVLQRRSCALGLGMPRSIAQFLMLRTATDCVVNPVHTIVAAHKLFGRA
jgi:hypothetical protein